MSDIIINPFFYPSGIGGSYEAEVQSLVDKRAAVSDPIATVYSDVLNDYVLALKAAGGHWSTITQLVVVAGTSKVVGSICSIKGRDLVSVLIDDADINPKTGATGGNAEYFYSGYRTGEFAQDNYHTFAYFTVPTNISVSSYYGAGSTGSGAWLMRRNVGNILFRSRNSTSDQRAQAATAGPYGLSRGSSSSYDYIIPSGSGTIARTSETIRDRPMNILATSNDDNDGGFNYSNGRFLVWAQGTHTDLSSYVTPTNDLITALNAI
jgi:hypothetical protein